MSFSLVQENLRALVIDDERVIRRRVNNALTKEGFICCEAANGEEAIEMLRKENFNLVVTDLRMPKMNGHELVVELLTWHKRPTIAVHTAVLEPRLTKDLMARGVDDILFKPTDYNAFAAKMAMLVSRKVSALLPTENISEHFDSKDTSERKSQGVDNVKFQEKTEIFEALEEMLKNVPLSPHAFSIYQATLKTEIENLEIANMIQQDAALTAEMLRIANAFVSRTNERKILSLEEIVLQLGRRRIGEIAISASANVSLSAKSSHLMNLDLIKRRNLGANLAARLIIGDSANKNECVALSALLHQLGRVVLCATFPRKYEKMLADASEQMVDLAAFEEEEFGETQSEILAQLLSNWGVESNVTIPLAGFDAPYSVLASIGPPHKPNAEIVKLSVLLSWLAVGQWEPWDLIELPQYSLLERHSLTGVRNLIGQIRQQIDCSFGSLPLENLENGFVGTVGYHRVENKGFDFIAEILMSMGLMLQFSDIESEEVVVLNCVGSGDVVPNIARVHNNVIEIRNKTQNVKSSDRKILEIPASYKKLRSAILGCFDQARS